MATAQGEGAGVPPQSKGSWTTFLKSLASFNGDLSSVTAPPFIVGTISLTEFSAYWTENPSVFVAPAKEQDPAKRALLVLKWFLTSLRPSYASRSDKLGSEKKPINPFLGELFLGKWVDEAGETELVSEQVSHHPPVTAYCISNEKHGVRLQGYNAQKASFSRTIQIKQIGHGLLYLKPFDETYLITLPALHIENLMYGKPFVELNNATYITSSSGFTSKIDYSGKGWLSGKKNTFSATLYPTGKEKQILYNIEGQWTDSFTIKSGSPSSKKHSLTSSSSDTLETYNAKTAPSTPLVVKPISEQSPLESHRAWQAVKDAIVKGDMDTTGNEKSKIENQQRDLRKKEQAEGKEWPRKYFTKVPEAGPLWDKLAAAVGEKIDSERTGGIWRFDEEKARNADVKI